MNEDALCAAVFEQALKDYETARRILADPFSKRKDREKANHRVWDVRDFSKSKEAIMYGGGSERVIAAFSARLDQIDAKHRRGLK